MQVEDRQTLELAITMATAAIQTATDLRSVTAERHRRLRERITNTLLKFSVYEKEFLHSRFFLTCFEPVDLKQDEFFYIC